MTIVLDGRSVAASLRSEIRADVAALTAERGRPPSLVAVEVGANEASASYIRAIGRACSNAGMMFDPPAVRGDDQCCGHGAGDQALREDVDVDGVIVQMPLPPHLDPAAAIEHWDPKRMSMGCIQ
jgi:methylenetetrahydrofolate dehydrogenase (NADP+)/methenyltetrahydrofolate cyclohydrolase